MARKRRDSEDRDEDDIIGTGGKKKNSSGLAAGQMKQFIERYEALESDKKAVMQDQKDLMAEAKGEGYDTKVLRQIIRERAADPEVLAEFQSVLELYKQAMGMD